MANKGEGIREIVYKSYACSGKVGGKLCPACLSRADLVLAAIHQAINKLPECIISAGTEGVLETGIKKSDIDKLFGEGK